MLELIKRFNIPGKHRILVIEARESALKALGVLSYKRDARGSKVYDILKPIPMEDILYIMAKTKTEDVRKTITLLEGAGFMATTIYPTIFTELNTIPFHLSP